MGDHRDYALRLLEKGVVCVPLRPEGKHIDLPVMGYEPLHQRTMRKELKELAFTGICFQLSQMPPSRETIASWFSDPGGNIGIVAGRENLLVLDFDNAGHFESWRRGREALVASTPFARSPSGYHVYLRSASPLVSSSLHFGLRRVGHAKSLGGYTVASPSILKGGFQYRWMPGQSLVDLDPVLVEDLADISLSPVSPIKRIYDRLLGRGYFTDS